MSDVADKANDTAQLAVDIRIAQSRAAIAKRELPITGRCAYCAETVPRPQIFCDSECAKWFEIYTKRR